MSIRGLISVSIVSHGQEVLVEKLLENLQKLRRNNLEILLTLNISPKKDLDYSVYSFPIKLIENSTPKGFGANHNAAFKQASGDYFCVLNPDILLMDDPFDELCKHLNIPSFGVVAPRIVDSDGVFQDSVRDYPSPLRILRRALSRRRIRAFAGVDPDWVAGMFMLFKPAVYSSLGGFDERYFMYCEDADICFRLKKSGYKLAYIPEVKVIHDAQRSSHGETKYLVWHLKSLIRFFISHPML